MSSSIGSLWLRWKALRLPWRRQFLAGQDLTGNTFWEFKNPLGGDPNRMRRIVKGPRKQFMSDVQISPQWHQWLRHTREDAPTIAEQQMDVTRQLQLKHNARLADERWAAKARYIEKPKEAPRTTFSGNREVEEGQETIEGGDAPKTEPSHKEGVRNAVASSVEQAGAGESKDPWEQERQKQKERASNPGGAWQPEAWSPAGPRRR